MFFFTAQIFYPDYFVTFYEHTFSALHVLSDFLCDLIFLSQCFFLSYLFSLLSSYSDLGVFYMKATFSSFANVGISSLRLSEYVTTLYNLGGGEMKQKGRHC